jgi:hypothetical protein
MSINNYFYLDATASRHELRDILVRADIGLEAFPDVAQNACAASLSTSVSIRDDLSYENVRPDNGVIATRVVSFHCRMKNDPGEYDVQIVRGMVALLKALPEADAYWEALDGRYPMLIRRKGHLILSADQTTERNQWDPTNQPSYLAMVDLPYTMEPLGQQWDDIPNESYIWRPASYRR